MLLFLLIPSTGAECDCYSIMACWGEERRKVESTQHLACQVGCVGRAIYSKVYMVLFSKGYLKELLGCGFCSPADSHLQYTGLAMLWVLHQGKLMWTVVLCKGKSIYSADFSLGNSPPRSSVALYSMFLWPIIYSNPFSCILKGNNNSPLYLEHSLVLLYTLSVTMATSVHLSTWQIFDCLYPSSELFLASTFSFRYSASPSKEKSN